MRLIDADALREIVRSKSNGPEDLWDTIGVLNAINNTPTVASVLSLDSISEEDIVKFKAMWQRANSKGLLAINEDRPQGEWIKWNFKTFGAMGDWEYKCSNCEKVYGGEYNFCPNCGADMRGGGME